jgi:hypothetical protein
MKKLILSITVVVMLLLLTIPALAAEDENADDSEFEGIVPINAELGEDEEIEPISGELKGNEETEPIKETPGFSLLIAVAALLMVGFFIKGQRK